MGRAPCCDKANVKKGPWSPEEDSKLKDFIEKYGTGGNWIALPHKAGLKRCGKSCRLRWLNYLRPNLKHGEFSQEEDAIICNLFATIGSRWSIIASQLPGRTDNDIKNYWNTKLKKKLLGITSPPHPSTKKLPHHHQQQHDQNQLQRQPQQDCFPSPILSPPSSTSSLIFQDHILKSISSSAPLLQYSNLLPHDHPRSSSSSSSSMIAVFSNIDQISCSSSYDINHTSNCTQFSYGKDLGFEFAAAAMEEENRLFLGGGGHQLESTHDLEYSYEEIKQLLISDSINSKANIPGEMGEDNALPDPQHYRGPSSFFRLAYASRSKKMRKQKPDVPAMHGMLIANAPNYNCVQGDGKGCHGEHQLELNEPISLVVKLDVHVIFRAVKA